MPISNYGELKAAVASRAVRTDLDAKIPDFVSAAHSVLAAKLVLCAELVAVDERAALPADFRTVVSVWPDTYPAAPLTMASEVQMRGLGGGEPTYFRIDGSDLVLVPATSGTARLRLLYKMGRESFDTDPEANTALVRYPSLYLYGAMAELAAHTRNADERDRYLSLFLAGVEAANASEIEDASGAATLRPLAGAVQ